MRQSIFYLVANWLCVWFCHKWHSKPDANLIQWIENGLRLNQQNFDWLIKSSVLNKIKQLWIPQTMMTHTNVCTRFCRTQIEILINKLKWNWSGRMIHTLRLRDAYVIAPNAVGANARLSVEMVIHTRHT